MTVLSTRPWIKETEKRKKKQLEEKEKHSECQAVGDGAPGLNNCFDGLAASLNMPIADANVNRCTDMVGLVPNTNSLSNRAIEICYMA